MKTSSKIKSKMVKKGTKNKPNTDKVQSEVKRILDSNTCNCKVGKSCKCGRYDESSTIFIRKFLTSLVKEAEQLDPEAKAPEEFSADTNKTDFDQSLEPETGKDQFDVQGTDPNVTADSIKSIKDWSAKLDQFAEFLNDPDTQSLHKILADNDRAGTLLRGITRKASDSITRIAGEIEKLKEVLNSFIIMAPKKQRDTEQNRMG